MPLETLQLRSELLDRVAARTCRQVRNLDIEVYSERVVLRGQVLSYYVKQLAQHGVKEYLPGFRLENAIQVAT